VNVLAASANISSVVNKWSQTIDDEYLFGLDSSNRLTFAWQTTAGMYGPAVLQYRFGKRPSSFRYMDIHHGREKRPGDQLLRQRNLDATFGAAADANPFRSGINTLRSAGRTAGGVTVLNGMIDEVRMYNQALTPAQIQGDMNAPIGKTALPTATYGFNEGAKHHGRRLRQREHGDLVRSLLDDGGRYGSALSFNGTNAYVEAANSNS